MTERRRRFDPDGFRRAAKDGADLEGAIVCAADVGVVKGVDRERREVRFTISSDRLDRHGDRVSVDGWVLESYRANPVVLWAHDYQMLPVGKARDIRVEDGKLKATATFTDAGVSRFNDTVFDLIAGGFLNATSVGFSPRKWAWSEADDRRFGIDYEEQELLEFSIVSVPANPEALIEARSAGIDLEPVRGWAERVLDLAPPAVTAERLAELEAAERELVAIKAAPRETLARKRLEDSALALATIARRL